MRADLSPHSNHGGLPGRAGRIEELASVGFFFFLKKTLYWRRNLRGKIKLVNLRNSVGKARANLVSQSKDTRGGLGNF